MNKEQIEEMFGCSLLSLCGKIVRVEYMDNSIQYLTLLGFCLDDSGDLSACVRESDNWYINVFHPSRIKIKESNE